MSLKVCTRNLIYFLVSLFISFFLSKYFNLKIHILTSLIISTGSFIKYFLFLFLSFKDIFHFKKINFFVLLRKTRLPTFFAIYYYKCSNFSSLIIPLFSIVAFNLHPNSFCLYSVYWFIPIVCYFFKKEKIFKFIGSSFVAHSVGSVIYIYTFSTNQEYWQNLITMVFLERFLVSFIMFKFNTICEVYFYSIKNLIKSYYSFKVKGIINE